MQKRVGDGGDFERVLDDMYDTGVMVRLCCVKRFEKLEIPKGRGGQRPRKFQGGGGLYDRFSFQRSFDSIRI